MNNLEYAKNLLETGENTLAVYNGKQEYVSQKRGVMPLVDMVESGLGLQGFSAADKIIGKASALLFAYLDVDEVYAKVISEEAKAILDKYEIKYECDEAVETIINRKGTGSCPMEIATKDIDDCDVALTVILKTLDGLNKKNSWY